MLASVNPPICENPNQEITIIESFGDSSDIRIQKGQWPCFGLDLSSKSSGLRYEVQSLKPL